MKKHNVIYLPKVLRYLEHLVNILYDHGYFGFRDNAKKYVKELFDDITENLPTHLKKPAPKHFDKYGKNMLYAIFRKNRQTAWYVFFTKYMENGEAFYLVRYIANNHVISQYL